MVAYVEAHAEKNDMKEMHVDTSCLARQNLYTAAVM
jgi:hypothetical protein